MSIYDTNIFGNDGDNNGDGDADNDNNNSITNNKETDLFNNDFDGDDGGGGDDADNNPSSTTNKKEVKPKSRIIRNPQNRLNVEKLMSTDRGIHKIEDHYRNVKFYGKRMEQRDLQTIMKPLELWAHRLYPKYTFDDFLTKAEMLGKRKQLQTHMYRYRQGLLDPVQPQEMVNNDGGDGDDDHEGTNINQNNNVNNNDDGDDAIDEFDYLIGQQIEKYKNISTSMTNVGTPSSSNRHHSTTDNNSLNYHTPTQFRSDDAYGSTAYYGNIQQQISTTMTTPNMNNNSSQYDDGSPKTPVHQSSINNDHHHHHHQHNSSTTPAIIIPTKTKLTSEQIAKITANRLLAQQKLEKSKLSQININEEN